MHYSLQATKRRFLSNGITHYRKKKSGVQLFITHYPGVGPAVTVLFITHYPIRDFQLFITHYLTQKKHRQGPPPGPSRPAAARRPPTANLDPVLTRSRLNLTRITCPTDDGLAIY